MNIVCEYIVYIHMIASLLFVICVNALDMHLLYTVLYILHSKAFYRITDYECERNIL